MDRQSIVVNFGFMASFTIAPRFARLALSAAFADPGARIDIIDINRRRAFETLMRSAWINPDREFQGIYFGCKEPRPPFEFGYAKAILEREGHEVLLLGASIESLYALPARFEPFGPSVLEAALCGCALILGDIASLRETWEGAALFVDPEDPEKLENLVEILINDSAYRKEMARRAKARAVYYAPERMA